MRLHILTTIFHFLAIAMVGFSSAGFTDQRQRFQSLSFLSCVLCSSNLGNGALRCGMKKMERTQFFWKSLQHQLFEQHRPLWEIEIYVLIAGCIRAIAALKFLAGGVDYTAEKAPVTPGWLGRRVEGRHETGRGASGAGNCPPCQGSDRTFNLTGSGSQDENRMDNFLTENQWMSQPPFAGESALKTRYLDKETQTSLKGAQRIFQILIFSACCATPTPSIRRSG